MTLQTLSCPDCKQLLPPHPGDAVPVGTLTHCLRRCERCGVGYSNARHDPVRIYEDPVRNVPADVRDGLLETLDRSVNVINRPNKRIKFGFQTSEDAVTWTVFRYLQDKGALSRVANVAGHAVATATTPRLLLWGAEVPRPSPATPDIETHLAGISAFLEEALDRRSEPDVILDFGPAGVIVVEAKLGSANDSLKSESDRWRRYLSAGFRDQEVVKSSGLYELTRNWRFALELAAGRPFTLVNLGRASLFDDKRLDAWHGALDQNCGGRFVKTTWSALLDPPPAEPWMVAFCEERRLMRPIGRRPSP